jgi:hypothetical protein
MSEVPNGLVRGIGFLDEGEAERRLIVKKYGAGKSTAGMTGPAEYVEAAAECLVRSFTTKSYVEQNQFRQLMRERRVPESVIDGFLGSCWIDDEAFLRDSD